MDCIQQYKSLDKLVSQVILDMDNHKYFAPCFIAHKNVITEIMKSIWNTYNLDLSYIQIDTRFEDRLYKLIIDENYVVSIESLCDSAGTYTISDSDYEFLDEDVPYGYIKFLKNIECPYEIFQIDES